MFEGEHFGHNKRFIEETETDKDLLDPALKKFRSYRESIEAWKAHFPRSINQDLCRENLLDKLSNNEIYLNLDWAMRFAPIKSRESQPEFFGQTRHQSAYNCGTEN